MNGIFMVTHPLPFAMLMSGQPEDEVLVAVALLESRSAHASVTWYRNTVSWREILSLYKWVTKLSTVTIHRGLTRVCYVSDNFSGRHVTWTKPRFHFGKLDRVLVEISCRGINCNGYQLQRFDQIIHHVYLIHRLLCSAFVRSCRCPSKLQEYTQSWRSNVFTVGHWCCFAFVSRSWIA